ncbi:hypothetical protein LX36DRAFT_197697 [Colletotrichum falcatum]|nr:hypothetical protein LX36DRAFT_197697 [Colletotrichum falcatum]
MFKPWHGSTHTLGMGAIHRLAFPHSTSGTGIRVLLCSESLSHAVAAAASWLDVGTWNSSRRIAQRPRAHPLCHISAGPYLSSNLAEAGYRTDRGAQRPRHAASSRSASGRIPVPLLNSTLTRISCQHITAEARTVPCMYVSVMNWLARAICLAPRSLSARRTIENPTVSPLFAPPRCGRISARVISYAIERTEARTRGIMSSRVFRFPVDGWGL